VNGEATGVTAGRIEQMARERQKLAEVLCFFDSNIWLGRPEGFPLASELAPDQIEEVLKSRFITGGLVSHWWGKTVSAQDGNEAVLRALEGQSESLSAVWTGLPLFPPEAAPVPGKGQPPAKVRGVRVFPRSHNFPLEGWSVGSLCEWLVSRQMPLFVWHTELDWNSLHRLARMFSALRVIVETQTQKVLYHTRSLFALMRECRNVSVEISNFAGQGFIEWAVRELGAERLIFGSFLPVNDPFVPMGMVLDAEIPERDKALIAGENLRRLINEVRA